MKVNAKNEQWDSSVSEKINECNNILSTCNENKSLLQAGSHDRLFRVVYNFLNDCVKGLVKKDGSFSAIRHINNLHIGMSSIILEVFNVLDAETNLDPQSKERNNLTFLVKQSEKVLSDSLLKERLEIESLHEMKLLDSKNFLTKSIKVKTKLYYKQKKFNLFREECEGYAKLVTELNQNVDEISTDYMLEVIKSLIGCFNLDPNRVLDVILDSFENQIEKSDFFVSLLQQYMPQSKTISDVLGFKFVYYIESRQITPKSLYIVTAFLLQRKVISLEDIYSWLQPDDSLIAGEWNDKLEEAKKRLKDSNAIIVSTKEKDDDTTTNNEEEIYKSNSNQKFGLLEALLRIGNWDDFHKICSKIPQTYVVSNYNISYNLCQLIHLLIDPIYKKYYDLKYSSADTSKRVISNPYAPSQVTNFTEMKEIVFPMLYTIGSYLSYDAELAYKIIRLLKIALIEAGVTKAGSPPISSEDSLYFEILTILDLCILPTLSAMPSNSCYADEVWDVLKLYPYNLRYALYARWKNETTYKYPVILYYNSEAMKKIKEIMKKITKETVKSAGRQIGKLTHSCPGFILEYVLSHIIMFDNLIALVVESLKFLTSLTYDFLSYIIIEILMQPNRINTKQTNGMASSWLVNLATFCGSIYKKYPIELVGILQYVSNQMKNHHSFDLLILKEVIQKMSGIEFSEDVTKEQLDALSGGDILRSEGAYFTHIRNMKKSISRLKEALMENDLAVTLCLLIGQQRDCIVYKEGTNVRLASYMYDECQDTLVQFGTFLNDDYTIKLPSIETLLTTYHLRPDVAFFLSRSKINSVIQVKFEELKKIEGKSKNSMKDEEKFQKYQDAVELVTAPLISAIEPLYPARIWENISPKVIIAFWTLSLYDLEVPAQSYNREITKLKMKNDELKISKDLSSVKIKKEQQKNNELIEKMKDELKKQQEHNQRVMQRLKQEKELWFPMCDSRLGKAEIITHFLQFCVFPRMMFTMVDTMYCAKFIQILQSMKTPNFPTLLFYDRLYCDITYTVSLCTENEARRYGAFLCESLKTIMHWHSNEKIYMAECANCPGFLMKHRTPPNLTESKSGDTVEFESYRQVCYKWHIFVWKGLVYCLESEDYVQIRNALIVLIRVLPQFPVMKKLCDGISRRVDKVIDKYKNSEKGLSTLAVSYNGLLKTKNHFIPEEKFHIVKNSSAATKSAAAAKTTATSHSVSTVTKTVNNASNSITSPTPAESSVKLKETKQETSSKSKEAKHESTAASAKSKETKKDPSTTTTSSKIINNTMSSTVEIKQNNRIERESRNQSDSKKTSEVDDRHCDKESPFELMKNKDDFIDRERDRDREKYPRDEKRDNERKREKKHKDDKYYDERKDDYRNSSAHREDVGKQSHRSGSTNSWHDYSSPHEEIMDSYERDREQDTKRRKITGKQLKTSSISNSPDESQYHSPPSDKKERRNKSKRNIRSSSEVIEIEPPIIIMKEKKRDSRKRIRQEEDEEEETIYIEKKKKSSEEKSIRSHRNGSSPRYESGSPIGYGCESKTRDRKSRDKRRSDGKKR